MTDLLVSESPAGYFSLQGHLNRNTVTGAWQDALSALKASKNKLTDAHPVVDLAGVTDVDTAGLAWLMNLLKLCRQHNILFTFENIPSTLINLAKISDVDHFLSVQ